jgi:uncharacterized membrane protein
MFCLLADVTATSSPALGSRNLLIALVLALTVLGLGLRFYRLSSQSLWTDEISSITVARAPLDQIYQQSAAVNNSLPAYFLLLRAAMGNSSENPEFRARWLSAIAGTLSIPVFIGVVYLWRRHWGAALLAGLLLATNPLHIWYSQETRAYALMLLFGLLTLLFFELARTSGPGRFRWMMWGLYLASGLGAIALHKTALVFPAICCLWHGVQIIRRHQRLRSLMVHLPILLAALVVLMLKSYPPGEAYGRRESGLEILYTFMTFVGGYSFGPSLTDIQSHGALAAVSQHLVQVGILFGVISLVGLAFVLDFRRLILGKETGLLLMGIGVVAGYAMISGFPYNVRYALSALFGLLALVAGFAANRPKQTIPRLALAGVLVVGLWADGQWFYSPGYRKGDSRAVSQWLVENKDRVKTWTVLPGYLSASVEWYLQSNPEVLSGLRHPAQDRTTSFPPLPDALIIGRRHHLIEPDRLVASYLSGAGDAQTNLSFTGFEIYTREARKR